MNIVIVIYNVYKMKKINNIKINSISLAKMNLKQIYVTFGDDIYNVIFNYDKIAIFHKIDA